MTSVVIPSGEDITAHLTDVDESWYVAVTNLTTGDTVLAESVTEVVQELVENYDPSDPEKAFLQRLDWVERATGLQQGLLAVAAANEGTLDIDTIGEDALTALFADRSEPAEVLVWDFEVPLLHVASHYDPYTERPRPVGANVHLIDPYTELTLLLSLASAGSLEVSFRENDDEDDEFAA